MRISKVCLIVTFACNASCMHCCNESSPERNEKMSFEMAKEIIDMYSPFTDSFAFSGGEVFLYFSEILELCRTAKKKGKKVILISNGFWGKDKGRALEIMKDLKNNHIDQLTISFDEYHCEFIDIEAIGHILSIAKQININTLIQSVVGDSFQKLFSIYDRLMPMIFEMPVTFMPCLRIGRAQSLMCGIKHSEILETSQNAKCTIFGTAFTILPNGNVFPCCSPYVFTNPGLCIGNVRDNPPEQLIRKRFEDKYYMLAVRGIKSNNMNICEACFDFLNDK